MLRLLHQRLCDHRGPQDLAARLGQPAFLARLRHDAEGARLKATQGLTLSVFGDIIITPFKTEHYNKVVAKKSGFLGTGRTEMKNRNIVRPAIAPRLQLFR